MQNINLSLVLEKMPNNLTCADFHKMFLIYILLCPRVFSYAAKAEIILSERFSGCIGGYQSGGVGLGYNQATPVEIQEGIDAKNEVIQEAKTWINRITVDYRYNEK